MEGAAGKAIRNLNMSKGGHSFEEPNEILAEAFRDPVEQLKYGEITS